MLVLLCAGVTHRGQRPLISCSLCCVPATRGPLPSYPTRLLGPENLPGLVSLLCSSALQRLLPAHWLEPKQVLVALKALDHPFP